MAAVAEPDEALGFIDARSLHGKGIGYVDVHLLASVALTAGSRLWTRDKRLDASLLHWDVPLPRRCAEGATLSLCRVALSEMQTNFGSGWISPGTAGYCVHSNSRRRLRLAHADVHQ
jgi:hypothetical protein